MFTKLLFIVPRILLGTGLGARFPHAHRLYQRVVANSQKAASIVEIPLGLRLKVQTNDTGPGHYLLSQGKFESFETQLVIFSLRKGDTFIDVGAHVGYYSMIAGKTVDISGRVVGVEPSEENVKLFQENVGLNSFETTVSVKQCAISDSNEISKIYLSPYSSGENSLIRGDINDAFVSIQLYTMDQFCKKYGLKPTIIKIDAEGVELRVLKGMKSTLSSRRLRTIFIEVSSVKNMLIIEKILNAAGFDILLINESRNELVPYTNKMAVSFIDKFGLLNIAACR